jgi:hypothetical protein
VIPAGYTPLFVILVHGGVAANSETIELHSSSSPPVGFTNSTDPMKMYKKNIYPSPPLQVLPWESDHINLAGVPSSTYVQLYAAIMFRPVLVTPGNFSTLEPVNQVWVQILDDDNVEIGRDIVQWVYAGDALGMARVFGVVQGGQRQRRYRVKVQTLNPSGGVYKGYTQINLQGAEQNWLMAMQMPGVIQLS